MKSPAWQTGVIAALPGTGTGGAAGPSVVASIGALKILPATLHDGPENDETPNLSAPSLFNAPEQLKSSDASVLESSVPLKSTQSTGRRSSQSLSVANSFTGAPAYDVSAATNGSNVVDTDQYSDVTLYTQTGSQLSYTNSQSFFCGGLPELPVCTTQNGLIGDGRVLYDTQSNRFVITAMYFGSKPVQTLMAVSKTSDPSGGWYLYQFPSCGEYDTWDGSDQPHTGFNNLWIVSTAACGPDPSGSGLTGDSLAVFDKSFLYEGAPLAVNGNWFEFQDPVELSQNRDNPSLTYVPTISNREYLVASAITSGGTAAIIYSHVEGTADAPVFYSKTTQVTTSFAASNVPGLANPSCSTCMQVKSNGWTHSSGVFNFNNGVPYILSTVVFGDPKYNPSSQTISVATNTDGGSTSLQLEGGVAGSGVMASEIGMPLVPNASSNNALIAYDHTRFDFYPGMKAALWDVDTNSLQYVSVLTQGNVSPTGSDASRWTDFIDAISPVPNSSQLFVGGTVAKASNNDPQQSTYFTAVTP